MIHGVVAVSGPGEGATPADCAIAEEVGALIATEEAVLVCGGLGGVMEAACRGARSKLGLTVGLLPGDDREDANGWVSVAIPTGLGEGRNALIVRAADALIAIGDSPGTSSEVALAVAEGVPVVALGCSREGVEQAPDAAAAVARALELSRPS